LESTARWPKLGIGAGLRRAKGPLDGRRELTPDDRRAAATLRVPVRLERLYPDRDVTTTEEATSGLRLGDLAPPGRPYLVLNMVATTDGRATIGGRSGPIGNEADRELFHGLRTQVDAVMVGAGTLRAERYGRIVRDPDRRERRRREGLDPDPLACIVSGRLDLPPDLPLLQDPDSQVLVATAAEEQLGECAATVAYLRAEAESAGRVDLERVAAVLRSEHSVRSVLCEGGPTLNGELLRRGLVDELFLSLAPKLTGGPDPLTIVEGVLPDTVELELVSLLESEGHLFLRYRMAG
jgi:riboflavin-specific deaminase-like protein